MHNNSNVFFSYFFFFGFSYDSECDKKNVEALFRLDFLFGLFSFVVPKLNAHNADIVIHRWKARRTPSASIRVDVFDEK